MKGELSEHNGSENNNHIEINNARFYSSRARTAT